MCVCAHSWLCAHSPFQAEAPAAVGLNAEVQGKQCVQHKYKLKYGTEVPTKATKRVRQPGDKRRRAAPATRAQLIEALLSKSKSGTTWRDVKKIKEKTGVYKDGAIRLQKEIPFP